MKPMYTPNFAANFSDDKMTESVKVSNERGHLHDDHIHHFEKYGQNGDNADNNQIMDDRDDKLINHEMIELGGNTRQIRTEYSQVSHIQSGFHNKIKTNQVEMLKELRSDYDHLKNLPMDRKKKPQHISPSSSPVDSQRDQTSEAVSSSKSITKERKLHRDSQLDNDKRQERIWLVERKQYEMIVTNCQQKIQQLLHAEMQYKRTIHELRSSSFPQKAPVVNKNDANLIRDLQNSLRDQKQKSKYLENQLEKAKSLSKQQIQKLVKLQSEHIYRNRENNKFQEEKRKLDDLLRLEKQKVMNCEIQKKKFQLEYQILERDKEMQIERVLRQLDHEKIIGQKNLRKEVKKYEEQIELKDKRYRLLLQEFEKLKKQARERHDPQPQMMTILEEFKNILSHNRSNQNQELSKALNVFMAKMEDNEDQVSIVEDTLENDRLYEEIKVLKKQISTLRIQNSQSHDLQQIKNYYEAEKNALKDTIRILQKKLKNKPKVEPKTIVPQLPISPKNNSNVESNQLRVNLTNLSIKLNQAKSLADQNQKLYLLYKGKWQNDEHQLISLKKQLNETKFELDKSRKQLSSFVNIKEMERRAMEKRLMESERKLEESNMFWHRKIEEVKRSHMMSMKEKNEMIQSLLKETTEITEIKQHSDEKVEALEEQYRLKYQSLAQKVGNSGNIGDPQLTMKYAMLKSAYDDMLMKFQGRSRKNNNDIDYLWQVKEVQYQNVNGILSTFEPRNKPIIYDNRA